MKHQTPYQTIIKYICRVSGCTKASKRDYINCKFVVDIHFNSTATLQLRYILNVCGGGEWE